MKTEDLLAALDLPAACRVDQRVPKKLLLENGAPTAADRRRINDGIEEIVWLAALKPSTIGVPDYRDDVRAYLEIAVLRLVLRPAAKAPRLVELVHRAIPYPVLLLSEQEGGTDLSAAHKRWAENESDRTVLDGAVTAAALDAEHDADYAEAFLHALALARQPRGSLLALYQGWLDTLLALHAARLTGAFRLPADGGRALARRTALAETARLDAEAARLRAAAAKEKQLARQVALNLEIKRIEAARKAACADL
jgi:hypothetical protein